MLSKFLPALVPALLGAATLPAHAQSAETVAPKAAPAPAPDANLFIFRERAEPLAWAPTVKIDGRKVAALGERKYTAVRVPPGEHVITLAWPLLSGQTGNKITLTVVEGRTHYLEIVGISRGFATASFAYLQMGSGIGEVSAQIGPGRVAACCWFKPPKY